MINQSSNYITCNNTVVLAFGFSVTVTGPHSDPLAHIRQSLPDSAFSCCSGWTPSAFSLPFSQDQQRTHEQSREKALIAPRLGVKGPRSWHFALSAGNPWIRYGTHMSPFGPGLLTLPQPHSWSCWGGPLLCASEGRQHPITCLGVPGLRARPCFVTFSADQMEFLKRTMSLIASLCL